MPAADESRAPRNSQRAREGRAGSSANAVAADLDAGAGRDHDVVALLEVQPDLVAASVVVACGGRRSGGGSGSRPARRDRSRGVDAEIVSSPQSHSTRGAVELLVVVRSAAELADEQDARRGEGDAGGSRAAGAAPRRPGPARPARPRGCRDGPAMRPARAPQPAPGGATRAGVSSRDAHSRSLRSRTQRSAPHGASSQGSRAEPGAWRRSWRRRPDIIPAVSSRPHRSHRHGLLGNAGRSSGPTMRSMMSRAWPPRAAASWPAPARAGSSARSRARRCWSAPSATAGGRGV